MREIPACKRFRFDSSSNFTVDLLFNVAFFQPLDLTDLDWSPEIWIACCDEDEQNARLASRAWEDNGLDVPEKFLDTLLHFLGKCNSDVHQALSHS